MSTHVGLAGIAARTISRSRGRLDLERGGDEGGGGRAKKKIDRLEREGFSSSSSSPAASLKQRRPEDSSLSTARDANGGSHGLRCQSVHHRPTHFPRAIPSCAPTPASTAETARAQRNFKAPPPRAPPPRSPLPPLLLSVRGSRATRGSHQLDTAAENIRPRRRVFSRKARLGSARSHGR